MAEFTPTLSNEDRHDPRPHRIMVAFAGDSRLVLDHCGEFFRWWSDSEELIGTTNPVVLQEHAPSEPDPDYGIWVLEPEISESYHHGYYGTSHNYTLHGEWRKATPDELARLQAMKSPWPCEDDDGE